MSFSDDEFDAFPDLFEGVDWALVPGLGDVSVPVPSPASEDDKSDQPPDPRPSASEVENPIIPPSLATSSNDTGEHSRGSNSDEPSPYRFDEDDNSFLEELSALEATLSQSPYMPAPAATPASSVYGPEVGRDGITPARPMTPTNLAATSSTVSVPASTGDDSDFTAALEDTATASKHLLERDDDTSSSRKKRSRRVDDLPSNPQVNKKRSKKKKNKGKEKVARDTDLHAYARDMLAGFEDDLDCPM
ncbi:uncharacterized protein FIBRA_03702 [Fibroporia radiculosa]|uniref:Uncharacterized protein n=1 Tax=Fibroporia radiculosa TaxID=599839 RepID=J4I9R9_9APHY|nr:uncharacterized protein FIBRA_03702 [Fibroporia radiculosa]CCM01641.1 predicted protein [Fibroporia radiculosa]